MYRRSVLDRLPTRTRSFAVMTKCLKVSDKKKRNETKRNVMESNNHKRKNGTGWQETNHNVQYVAIHYWYSLSQATRDKPDTYFVVTAGYVPGNCPQARLPMNF